MAETTTTAGRPVSTTSRATWAMRSRSATEVPPNFITITVYSWPDDPGSHAGRWRCTTM